MSWGEVAASLFFTWAVTLLGYQIFNYYDFTAPKFFFAIVLATAHFSLLKSPQPDAGSPLHDNKLTSYTRGLYVVIVAAAILILNAFAGITPQKRNFLPNFFFGWAGCRTGDIASYSQLLRSHVRLCPHLERDCPGSSGYATPWQQAFL